MECGGDCRCSPGERLQCTECRAGRITYAMRSKLFDFLLEQAGYKDEKAVLEAFEGAQPRTPRRPR